MPKVKSIPSSRTSEKLIGPTVDNGAPYSAIGYFELCLLASDIIPDWDGTLDAPPSSFVNKRKWQYGVGMHSSESRHILGAITLTAKFDCATIKICHLVSGGSSQLVIGRNVTSRGNILHMNNNCLQISGSENRLIRLSFLKYDMHSHLAKISFCCNDEGVLSRQANASAASIRGN